MWVSFKKYYKLIILAVVVVVLIVYGLNWYQQKQDEKKLFSLIDAIDYSSVEPAVLNKLTKLV